MIRRPLIAALVGATMLSGCNLAPKYVRPVGAVPAALPQSGVPLGAASADADVTAIGWRDFFTDDRLRQVIAQGLANNRDLRIAAANVLQARERYRIQRADRVPSTNLSGTANFSFEEVLSGGQAPALYALSLLLVFLCLAALYESWSVPLAVVLVVPLGVLGALLAATLVGLNNDIYLQVGLITTIGVSAKNAILIIEFAEERMREGMNAFDAAMEAARLRLRPILMTSLAFVFGVLPLALSTGAGAGGQHAIGWAVVGGMLSATILAIFFVPMFFVVVVRLFGGHGPEQASRDEQQERPAPQEA